MCSNVLLYAIGCRVSIHFALYDEVSLCAVMYYCTL